MEDFLSLLSMRRVAWIEHEDGIVGLLHSA